MLRRTGILVIVALALGAAAGRFVEFGGGSGSSGAGAGAAAAAPVSPADRVQQLETAVRRDPDDLRSLQALGAAYVQSVAAGGDIALYNDAEAVLEQADALAPGNPTTVLTQGYLALARHDFGRAHLLGTQAHASDPFDADALAVIIDAEVELGLYDEAAVHLQELLDLRPGLAAYSRVSYLRELHGDLTGARQAFAQAETAGSDRYDLASVAVLRGKLALTQDDLDEADVQFERARGYVEIPTGVEAGEARLLAARGDIGGAIAVLEVAVRERPSAEVAILLGDLLRLEGRAAAAEDADDVVRELAVEERAAGADVDMELALFEADRGNGATGLELARAAYQRKPDNITANIAMGWTLRATGSAGEAVPYIDRALRLGTRDGLLHFRAAAVLADAGLTDRARQELATAYEINPHFSFGHVEAAGALAVQLGVPVPA